MFQVQVRSDKRGWRNGDFQATKSEFKAARTVKSWTKEFPYNEYRYITVE